MSYYEPPTNPTEAERAMNLRRMGAMNTEPPTRATTDAGVKAAVRELSAAEPYLATVTGWATAARAPNDYADALNEYVEAVQLAKVDPLASNLAKWQRIDALTAQWRPRAERIVTGLENAVAKWDDNLTAAARPSAPTSDKAVLEARLANARTDAVMVLDRAADADVPERLAELARGSDSALAYLILGTPWPSTYLRARGSNAAVAQWEHERQRVLAEVLTDAALAAHSSLRGVSHARKAAAALRAAQTFFVRDNPELFEG